MKQRSEEMSINGSVERWKKVGALWAEWLGVLRARRRRLFLMTSFLAVAVCLGRMSVIGATMPFGLVFQLPVVALFLHHIELLTVEVMTTMRKYAYFALLVITALIAPPDVFTHLVTLIPMILLYELSIILIKRKERKEAAKAAKEEAAAEKKERK